MLLRGYRKALGVTAASTGRVHTMPRKESKEGKGQKKESEKAGQPTGPVVLDKHGSVFISVHAKPGSKLNAITGPIIHHLQKKVLQGFAHHIDYDLADILPNKDVTAEAVGVAIAAPPSEGEANAELCRYLSKVLEVKKSEVNLDKGGKSREKIVKISAAITPEIVLEKLKSEASKS